MDLECYSVRIPVRVRVCRIVIVDRSFPGVDSGSMNDPQNVYLPISYSEQMDYAPLHDDVYPDLLEFGPNGD